MITKTQAESAKHGQEFYFIEDGKVKRARVNGKCKVWKTRPDDFRLPMKFGMYACFYITPENASHWYSSEEEAQDILPPEIKGRIGTKKQREQLNKLLLTM